MKRKTLLKAIFCGLLLCFAFGMAADDAMAQGDRELATREGVSGSLHDGGVFERDKMPGTLEVGFAVGSIIIMIAVFKWL